MCGKLRVQDIGELLDRFTKITMEHRKYIESGDYRKFARAHKGEILLPGNFSSWLVDKVHKLQSFDVTAYIVGNEDTKGISKSVITYRDNTWPLWVNREEIPLLLGMVIAEDVRRVLLARLEGKIEDKLVYEESYRYEECRGIEITEHMYTMERLKLRGEIEELVYRIEYDRYKSSSGYKMGGDISNGMSEVLVIGEYCFKRIEPQGQYRMVRRWGISGKREELRGVRGLS